MTPAAFRERFAGLLRVGAGTDLGQALEEGLGWVRVQLAAERSDAVADLGHGPLEVRPAGGVHLDRGDPDGA